MSRTSTTTGLGEQPADAHATGPLPEPELTTRRSFLAASAAAGAGLALVAAPRYAPAAPATEGASVRPFHVGFPEEALVDLRRRVAATKWPGRETVNDATQG